ncbi:MAG: hypothetical protein AABN95_02985 [Acidobacteriota bacterium]
MRAIRLHPLPDAEHECPHCRLPLKIMGWLIPGMRNLAELQCPGCGRDYYGDLAVGQALYTPMLLEKESGVVFDKHGVEWFADWLRDSYTRRTDVRVPFKVEERSAITRPVVVLNCLDTLYGHSLLKVLNAQYYLEREIDLIVIIPSFLAWMIPEGVAQVWIVGLPLNRGTEWNDWLGHEIHRLVEAFETVGLSQALSHPNPGDYNIARFTGVKPFPLEQWEPRLDRPTVTFIWRDDRTWQVSNDTSPGSLRKKLRSSMGLRFHSLVNQRKAVVELAEALRSEFPTLDFAVAGLSEGKDDHLPTWIEDLRTSNMNDDGERVYCERYGSSHVVIGVHGSNMLLPSAHSGSVVELIGPGRWGNFLQDILIQTSNDCRDTLFRYRFLPDSSPPQTVVQLVTSMLKGQPAFRRLMKAR